MANEQTPGSMLLNKIKSTALKENYETLDTGTDWDSNTV